MGDELLRHRKLGGRLRKDGAPQKGHASASAHKHNHNMNISSEIANSSPSSLEENQFISYFMENHKRKPNTNQNTPKKLQSAKPSPSIIAKLMGLKDLPLEKGLEKANKKSGGSFHKPSLSGLMNSKHVEFKDVFEVIEERNQQQDKGHSGKDFFKNKEFDFENYRDNFVKNIEKSNPLFSKHLLDLRCYPPLLHKGMVSRSKSGYVNEHTSTKNLKMKNLGLRNNCSQHDHIVILDPKMENVDQDPKFQRTLQQKFWENLEHRRHKMWRFDTIGHQEGEYCKRNILKLEKLRRFNLNFSNEGTKSLAEMLETPDMERSEKNFDSQNYYRKVLKSKFAREGYYEKAEGSFANLPHDISPIAGKSSLLEREDVVKLRARKHKLKENFTLKGNVAGRFSEKEICMQQHDQRVRSGNHFETAEKMVFTIDERQNAWPNTNHSFAKEGKKYGHEKLRASIEDKEECFSVMNFNRNTNSKEAEIPSPISVLEPTPIESESSSSSFFKPDSDHHENDMKIKEDLETCTSSDDDDDSQGTTYDNKNSTLNQLRDQEEREFSYLLDMLIQSGIHEVCSGTLQKAYHSRNFPVDPHMFDRLERRYGQISTWSKSDRRLLFDMVNSVLAIVLAPCLDSHPWVRCNRHVGSAWGPEGMVEKLWLVLSRQREKIRSGDVEEQLLDFNLVENLGDDINVVGKQIERMLTDEILEETILGFLSVDRLRTCKKI